LNSQAIKNLKSWAKNSLCPDGNLIEIMACSGGCVGGSSCIKDKKLTAKQIQKNMHQRAKLSDLEP
jgi:iron only hydrogenase large subunit-like protein